MGFGFARLTLRGTSQLLCISPLHPTAFTVADLNHCSNKKYCNRKALCIDSSLSDLLLCCEMRIAPNKDKRCNYAQNPWRVDNAVFILATPPPYSLQGWLLSRQSIYGPLPIINIPSTASNLKIPRFLVRIDYGFWEFSCWISAHCGANATWSYLYSRRMRVLYIHHSRRNDGLRPIHMQPAFDQQIIEPKWGLVSVNHPSDYPYRKGSEALQLAMWSNDNDQWYFTRCQVGG